ncbi:hypothetical protein CR513_07988, partial [Mucuna pruriens]
MTRQVNGEYQAKDPQLVKYLDITVKLAAAFEKFTPHHLPREQNERANLLSKLTTSQKRGVQKSIIHKRIDRPTIEEPEVDCIEERTTWMSPLIAYLRDEIKKTYEGQPKKGTKKKDLRKTSPRVPSRHEDKDLRRTTPMVPSRHEEKKTYEGWPKNGPLQARRIKTYEGRTKGPLQARRQRPVKDGPKGPLQPRRKKDLRRTVGPL